MFSQFVFIHYQQNMHLAQCKTNAQTCPYTVLTIWDFGEISSMFVCRLSLTFAMS